MRISNPQPISTLTSLPKLLLQKILDLLYTSTITSPTFSVPSHPQVHLPFTPENSFQHRILATKTLRSVCSPFHTWALETMLRDSQLASSRLHVNCTIFPFLMQEFSLTRNQLFQRLFRDFPYLAGSGVILYLGHPLDYIQETNLVFKYPLENTVSSAFEGLSFMGRACGGHVGERGKGWPLKGLRRWERLVISMCVCGDIFEGVVDDEDGVKVRQWIIRGNQASSPCLIVPNLPKDKLENGKSKPHAPDAYRRLSFRPDWDETSISDLLECCRNLRSKYEENRGELVDWSIDIHLTVLVGDKIGGFCVHDMVFMPLRRPPNVEMKRCEGRRCAGKVVGEENWMMVDERENVGLNWRSRLGLMGCLVERRRGWLKDF